MDNVKVFELSDLMPIYWTDGINTISLPNEEKEFEESLEISQVENMPFPKRRHVEIIRIIRNTTKSKELKELYKGKCQVCGETLPTKDGFYSEVHHLQPLGGDHKGVDDQSNMIVVCPNHHALFDAGAIAIVPKTLEIISYNGIVISLLSRTESHIIHENFIRYHFENRFNKIF